MKQTTLRKIRIFEHISLDGVIAPRGDDDYSNGGWTAPYRGPEGRDAVIALQGADFDLLLGRRTYDLWSGYWPKAEKSPIADSLNAAKKYVATHRPESLAWGPAAGLGNDVIEGVRQIKSEGGKDLIVWGSSTLTSALLDHGLVEEVVLFIYPVLLGGAKRFFSENVNSRELALVSSKTTTAGVNMNVYRHVGALKRGA